MGERWTPPDRFRPDELDGDTTAGEQAQVMATARELEWLAATDDLAPSAGFSDRVMAAIAAEPTPRPMAAAASAARRGALLSVLAAFGDLWRVAWSGGRPMAVRGPAMAVVLLVLVGSVGAGALGVGALSRLLQGPSETPPSQVASPSPAIPSLSPSPPQASPSPEASPSPSAEPTTSPSPTIEPTDSPEATEQATPRATRTPRPADTPEPSESPEESHESDDSGSGHGSDGD